MQRLIEAFVGDLAVIPFDGLRQLVLTLVTHSVMHFRCVRGLGLALALIDTNADGAAPRRLSRVRSPSRVWAPRAL